MSTAPTEIQPSPRGLGRSIEERYRADVEVRRAWTRITKALGLKTPDFSLRQELGRQIQPERFAARMEQQYPELFKSFVCFTGAGLDSTTIAQAFQRVYESVFGKGNSSLTPVTYEEYSGLFVAPERQTPLPKLPRVRVFHIDNIPAEVSISEIFQLHGWLEEECREGRQLVVVAEYPELAPFDLQDARPFHSASGVDSNRIDPQSLVPLAVQSLAVARRVEASTQVDYYTLAEDIYRTVDYPEEGAPVDPEARVVGRLTDLIEGERLFQQCAIPVEPKLNLPWQSLTDYLRTLTLEDFLLTVEDLEVIKVWDVSLVNLSDQTQRAFYELTKQMAVAFLKEENVDSSYISAWEGDSQSGVWADLARVIQDTEAQIAQLSKSEPAISEEASVAARDEDELAEAEGKLTPASVVLLRQKNLVNQIENILLWRLNLQNWVVDESGRRRAASIICQNLIEGLVAQQVSPELTEQIATSFFTRPDLTRLLKNYFIAAGVQVSEAARKHWQEIVRNYLEIKRHAPQILVEIANPRVEGITPDAVFMAKVITEAFNIKDTDRTRDIRYGVIGDDTLPSLFVPLEPRLYINRDRLIITAYKIVGLERGFAMILQPESLTVRSSTVTDDGGGTYHIELARPADKPYVERVRFLPTPTLAD